MSVLKEKVAYLKGMLSGLNMKEAENQQKIINSILETMDEFAEEIERIDVMQSNMQEQVDSIDEDLGALEEEFYEGEEEEMIEIVCPHCEETIAVASEELCESDEVECPACHKKFEIEWECDCDDCHDHNCNHEE